jgi:signal peptidase II
MTRRIWLFASIFVIVVAFDQGSKAWAHTLPVSPAGCAQPAELLAGRCAGVPQPVIAGLWDWELAYNPGAAFSSFIGGAAARVVLSLIAALALVAIGIAAVRTPPGKTLRLVALALVAGGALGNLIDRLRDGAVTDFVRWQFHEHRWPIFNVADAALLVGVAIWFLDGLRDSRRDAPAT